MAVTVNYASLRFSAGSALADEEAIETMKPCDASPEPRCRQCLGR